MAQQREVIGPRTHGWQSWSWIRKIGSATYRFNVTTREDGRWTARVDRSVGGRGRHWETVHHWILEEAVR